MKSLLALLLVTATLPAFAAGGGGGARAGGGHTGACHTDPAPPATSPVTGKDAPNNTAINAATAAPDVPKTGASAEPKGPCASSGH